MAFPRLRGTLTVTDIEKRQRQREIEDAEDKRDADNLGMDSDDFTRHRSPNVSAVLLRVPSEPPTKTVL